MQYVSGIARVYVVARHKMFCQKKLNLFIRSIFPTGVLSLSYQSGVLLIVSFHPSGRPACRLPSTTSRPTLFIANLSMLLLLTQITAIGTSPNARNLCALQVTLIQMVSETKQHSSGGVRRGDTRRKPSVRGQRANCELKVSLAGARMFLSVHC